MRIAKFISNSGYCSRRKAENIIYTENVYIDGKKVLSPIEFVNNNSIVTINNKIIKISKNIEIVLLYKPINTVTTHKDEMNRQSIFDILPKKMKKMVFIGRLDIKSEGLILLTNNRTFATNLTSPKNSIKRIYEVKVFGYINNIDIKKMLYTGIKINGFQYKSIVLEIIHSTNNNHWFRITLTEGKNREIRNIMEYFGLKISKLIRVKFGNFSLKNMLPGQYKIINISDSNDKI